MEKSPDAFRTISEVADWLGTPTHVLRFWESRFTQVKPVKRAGGRRYYRPSDMELLGGIKKLLHEDGMTIRGVQKMLREEGIKHVAALSPPLDMPGEAAEAPYQDVPESAPTAEVVSFDERRPAAKRRASAKEQALDAEPAEAPEVAEANDAGEENAVATAAETAPEDAPVETVAATVESTVEPVAEEQAEQRPEPPADSLTEDEAEPEAGSDAAAVLPDAKVPSAAEEETPAKAPEPVETTALEEATEGSPKVPPSARPAPGVDARAIIKALEGGKRPEADALRPIYERLARLSVRMAAEPSNNRQ